MKPKKIWWSFCVCMSVSYMYFPVFNQKFLANVLLEESDLWICHKLPFHSSWFETSSLSLGNSLPLTTHSMRHRHNRCIRLNAEHICLRLTCMHRKLIFNSRYRGVNDPWKVFVVCAKCERFNGVHKFYSVLSLSVQNCAAQKPFESIKQLLTSLP